MVTVGNGERGGSIWDRFGGIPCVAAIGIVGLVLSPLLIGIEPVGGDPDLMYRPIKTALAEALGRGTLPYWSDFLGIGVPIVAESHAAAFYPPNWIAYRLFDVPLAYRLLMWAHYVACAAATYAYARVLRLGGWGAALAAVAFTLGGFQAGHACHEPFYTLLPYLPLSLLLAERFLATGRIAWLGGLALCWGTQITLGHFQIQMWTGGLVALTGLAWLMRDRRCWRRVAALLGGLLWGLTVASPQMFLTSELTQVSGFNRAEKYMMTYAFPTQHLAQWVLPPLFLCRNLNRYLDRSHPYWSHYASTPEESSAYIGVTAVILACLGIAAAWRSTSKTKGTSRIATSLSPSMTMWFWVSLAGMVLATMPHWWPSGFQMVLKIPGFALFRAPGRYMLLPNLGLALWAARGIDSAIGTRRFRAGLVLAIGILIAALAQSFGVAGDANFQALQGGGTIPWRYAISLLIWALAVVAIVSYRRGRVGPWGPLGVAALELAGMFYFGPTLWGRSVAFPGASPMLARLKQEQGVGLVAGRLQNLPVRAGVIASYPIVGITAPPPNYLLEQTSNEGPGTTDPNSLGWQRRFGVSHGIWEGTDDVKGTELIAEGEDPVLGTLIDIGKVGKDRQRWKLVRYRDPFPAAWVATKAVEAGGWGLLYSTLAEADLADEAWFLPEDRPPQAKPDPNRDPRAAMYGFNASPKSDIDLGPRATTTRIVDWDGRSGTVEHDGSCVLILRRAHYPGWTARVNDGPESPVARVSGGLQGIVLAGKGPSRIVTSYRPTRLGFAKTLSLTGVLAALGAIAASAIGMRTRRRGVSVS